MFFFVSPSAVNFCSMINSKPNFIISVQNYGVDLAVLLSLALVLGLEGQVLGLGLEGQGLGLGLGLEQKSLALTNQVLGLARLVFRETNTVTILKAFSSHE